MWCVAARRGHGTSQQPQLQPQQCWVGEPRQMGEPQSKAEAIVRKMQVVPGVLSQGNVAVRGCAQRLGIGLLQPQVH